MFSSTPFKSTFALVSLALLALTGCSSTENSSGNSADSSTSASVSAAAGLTVTDAWAKAADSGMTAVFGKINNTTGQAITITGASSTATNTGNTQLHTTEVDAATGNSAMKQVESFTIEPGETFTLEAGGNHIMLMDLTCSLPAGSTLEVILTTDSGESVSFTAQARDYSGAQEEYAPGETEHSDHSNHEDTGSETALDQCS